jgi:hypothetical protein
MDIHTRAEVVSPPAPLPTGSTFHAALAYPEARAVFFCERLAERQQRNPIDNARGPQARRECQTELFARRRMWRVRRLLADEPLRADEQRKPSIGTSAPSASAGPSSSHGGHLFLCSGAGGLKNQSIPRAPARACVATPKPWLGRAADMPSAVVWRDSAVSGG